MKEFITSAQSVQDGMVGTPMTIKVDDDEITFSSCTESQMAVLLAAAAPTGDTVESIADTINFFFSMIEDQQQYSLLKQRLFDRDDPFGVNNITDILLYLIEEWSARPTQSPSDSTPLRPSAGRRSTARLQDTA